MIKTIKQRNCLAVQPYKAAEVILIVSKKYCVHTAAKFWRTSFSMCENDLVCFVLIKILPNFCPAGGLYKGNKTSHRENM